VVGDLPFLQRPLPEKSHECPDQRIHNLLVREMLRIESKAELLNSWCQEIVLEHSRIFLPEEIVERGEHSNSALQVFRVFRVFNIRFLKKIKCGNLRIVNRQMLVGHVQ
jgi:hypothetical protein